MDSKQKVLVGVDEAGYGPNLGPLVVVAVSLRVWSRASSTKLWESFAPEVSRFPPASAQQIVVDDSKRVYAAGQGLDQLERTALAWLGLSGAPAQTLEELWTSHSLTPKSDLFEGPWHADREVRLPRIVSGQQLREAQDRLARALVRTGCSRAQATCHIVLPRRFNQLIGSGRSKAAALFGLGSQLVKHLFDSADTDELEVVLDKHGGRHFYRQLLQEAFPETLVMVGREGPRVSQYQFDRRGRRLCLRFEPKADTRHMLVAVASMIAKYLRELCMQPFNDFWRSYIPELRPTAGYPLDAWRFRRTIQPVARRLGIATELFWRER